MYRCGRVCYSRSSLALQCSSHHLPASFKEEARVKAQLSQRFDLILKLARLIVCSRNQHVRSHSSANIMSSMGARAILGHLPLNLPYLQPTNAILVIRTGYGVQVISRPPKRAVRRRRAPLAISHCEVPHGGGSAPTPTTTNTCVHIATHTISHMYSWSSRQCMWCGVAWCSECTCSVPRARAHVGSTM